MTASLCTAPNCKEKADGILMVRYSWKERFRPHNGNGRYCGRHLVGLKPGIEGESHVLPPWPILVVAVIQN